MIASLNKQRLVIINGWAMPRSVWGEVDCWLSDYFEVFWVDIDRARSLDEWGIWLKENSPDDALWLGWSLGGQLAMHLASVAPRKVRGLIMLTSTPRFLKDEHSDPQWLNGQSEDNFNKLQLLLAKSTDSLIKRFALMQTLGQSAAKETAGRIAQQMGEVSGVVDKKVLQSGLSLLAQIDLREWCEQTSIPAHFILGEADSVVLVKKDDLWSMNSKFVVTSIEGMGHFPFLGFSGALKRVFSQIFAAYGVCCSPERVESGVAG